MSSKLRDTPVFTPVFENGRLKDVRADVNGRRIAMLGEAGEEREIGVISRWLAKKRDELPVLLGAGLGPGLVHLLQNWPGPLAIVDAEPELRDLTHIEEQISPGDAARILWVTDQDPAMALSALTNWQQQNQLKPFAPLAFSFYQRVQPDFYAALRKSLEASASFNFWQKAQRPRFVSDKPRLLLMASKYFLIGALETACKRLGLPYKLLMVGEDEVDGQDFVKKLLENVLTFQPDCAVTLNHMGVDREGLLMDLLARLQLPLASWFVDNPHLIVHCYSGAISPWTTIFTWDEDNLPSLRARGFEHVRYLPLATDPERFRPGLAGLPQWKAGISFVGNSMLYKIGGRLKHGHFPRAMLLPYKEIGRAFAASSERDVANFLRDNFPEVYACYLALPDEEQRLAYETAITWQATRVYRNDCVSRLLPFHPLIVGDEGWLTEFRRAPIKPRHLPPISYYDDLPRFYGMSKINFNCTSKQMKGAVNQRVFDAPATGSFVLTDWRPQMAHLFEPDEMACFHDPEEIPELCEYYLNHPSQRRKLAEKGRQRVLACHKWEDRLAEILEEMRKIYGGRKM